MAQDLDPCSLGTALARSSTMPLAAIRGGSIAFANPAFRAIFRASAVLTGSMLQDVIADCDHARLAAAVEAANDAPITFIGAGTRGDGVPFDLELRLERTLLDGEAILLASATDVTEQYRSRERLAYLAYADPLTGLPNRTLLFDRLHQTMLGARRHGSEFAVLMADLDGFKPVNDCFGHDVGDAVLQQVAQRFRKCVRESDTLARLGGDEFAVMLPHLTNGQVAALAALRLIKALEDPIVLAERQIVVGTSVGIASYPKHAGAIEPLLVAADTAMYQAKRSGRNKFQWATPAHAANWSRVTESTWHATHAVGVDEIDEQHMHLAGLVDQLIARLRAGAGHAEIAAAMNEVIDYAILHFASEERLMAEYAIADATEHHQMHRRLIDDIRSLRLDSNMPDLGLLLRYLREWLIRHIDGPDKELGRALQAKGCH
jgi:diguanylate cyclase (GGDEF)-like protein/hemerythrin-like metal-binding protein